MRMTTMAGLGAWALMTALGTALAGAGARAQLPSAPGLPRLTGIVIAGHHRAAIFENPPGLTTAIGEGETIAAYTVRAIHPDGVQIESEGRSFALTLSQSPRAAAPVDDGGVTFGKVVNPQGPPDD